MPDGSLYNGQSYSGQDYTGAYTLENGLAMGVNPQTGQQEDLYATGPGTPAINSAGNALVYVDSDGNPQVINPGQSYSGTPQWALASQLQAAGVNPSTDQPISTTLQQGSDEDFFQNAVGLAVLGVAGAGILGAGGFLDAGSLFGGAAADASEAAVTGDLGIAGGTGLIGGDAAAAGAGLAGAGAQALGADGLGQAGFDAAAGGAGVTPTAAAAGTGALGPDGLGQAGFDAAVPGSAGITTPTLASGLGTVGSTLVKSIPSAIGAVISGNAANKAANTISNAANTAAGASTSATNSEITNLQPWVTAGAGAVSDLSAGSKPGGQFNKPYTLQDFENGPQAGLYDLANKEAQTQLTNRLSTSGGVNTTNGAVQGAQEASNLAAQYYDTGFNENNTTNLMAENTLQSLAGEGITGATGQNSALTNNATTQGNAALTAGNANAAGQVSTANTYGNLVSSLGKDLLTMNTLQSIFS